MGLRAYLPIAIATFLVATTGADLVARTHIGGQPLAAALQEHFYWAGVQFVGTMLLLAPFIAVALLCARVETRVRTRSVLIIFAIAMMTLLYFYFQGHQAAERAALKKMWTAATLSIGLLPFFIGLPVIIGVIGAGEIAAKLDPRKSA